MVVVFLVGVFLFHPRTSLQPDIARGGADVDPKFSYLSSIDMLRRPAGFAGTWEAYNLSLLMYKL